MSITRQFARKRRAVLWLGPIVPEPVQSAFVDRGHHVKACTDAQLEEPATISGAAAAVLVLSPDLAQTGATIRRHVGRLLDYGCMVVVQPTVADSSDTAAQNSAIDYHLSRFPRMDGRSVPPPPYVRVVGAKETWHNIANDIVGVPPENPPAPPELLRIVVQNEHGAELSPLHPDEEVLVRRAFSDCSEVRLVEIMDGNSGVNVYQGFPKLRATVLPIFGEKWLLPYFVKVGNRDKVFSEYENYIDAVQGFIPFHLGPHLVHERCALGARNGILVGDWVEESESLKDCARDGRAAAAIACLFGRTLHGWYRNAIEDHRRSIASALKGRFPRKLLGKGRKDRIRELGATEPLGALRTLFKRCNAKGVLIAPIHGDLHASNVRVRASDAIVIDFLQHNGLPVLFDFACLEASLLVDGFNNRPETDTQRWVHSVEDLFATPLNMAPKHTDPHEPSCWFHTSVRQIRHEAWRVEISPNQYAACLALALLIKSTKDVDAPEPEATRRAAAYVFAERILSGAFGAAPAALPVIEAAA